MDNNEGILFVEIQTARDMHWPFAVLVALIGGLAWAGFIWQIILGQQFGTNPSPDLVMWIVAIFVGVGIPALFLSLRLIVEVKSDGISVRYSPFMLKRFIAWSELLTYEVREYHPIAEYGGWGIKYSYKYGRAYNVSGNLGVQLVLKDEKQILIGSLRPDELQMAIDKGIAATRKK